MRISTRGSYALRVIIDLAEHNNGNYIPLKDVAERQEISQKYLESIMHQFSKAGLIDGRHGKGGGYKLNRAPEEYTVLQILTVTEGDIAPVSCLENGAQPCVYSSDCRTQSMWSNFYKLVKDYFNGVTVADLMKKPESFDYII